MQRLVQVLTYSYFKGEEVHERFKFSKPWSDPDGPLALNDKQSENLLGMLRPSEIVEFQSKSNKLTDIPACAVVKCITPYTITQVHQVYICNVQNIYFGLLPIFNLTLLDIMLTVFSHQHVTLVTTFRTK